MSELVPVDLHLSHEQIKKAISGKPIQISAAHPHKTTHRLHLHPANHAKLMKAKKARKGVRLQLSEHEIHASGLFDFLKDIGSKLKQGYDYVKDHVIDTPFYQQSVKPVVHDLVNQGIDTFVPAPARAIAHDAANAIGSKTSAFGLRRPGHVKRGRKPRQHAMHEHYAGLQDNYSNLMSPMHPSAHPFEITLPAPGLKAKGMRRSMSERGGSFMAA